MPRSEIAYLNREAFAELKDSLTRTFEGQDPKPYTMSLPQRTKDERVRLRITELADGVVFPLITEFAGQRGILFSSSADREVRDSSYRELIENGDRFETAATIQFVSPLIVDVQHLPIPFPVMPSAIARYVEVWNAFAPMKFPLAPESLQRVAVSDFRISCMPTSFGIGGQGWVTLGMGRGMTEEYIGLVNCLVDFSFYSGTGLHTDVGLGQTRRMDGKVQRPQPGSTLVGDR